MIRKILLRAVGAMLAVLMLFGMTGCSASRKVRASTRAGRVVATAGDFDILYENLYYLAMNQIAAMKQLDENAFADGEGLAELQEFLDENLLTRSDALLALGEEYGLDPDKGELGEQVQKYMDDMINTVFAGDRKAYIESLNTSYLTDRYVRRYMAATQYLPSAIIEKMLLEGDVLDDDDQSVREKIDTEFIRVEQIVFLASAYYPAGNMTGEEAYAYAKEMATRYRERVASKEDINERLDELSEAGRHAHQSDTTGNGLYFPRGYMEESFEEAVFDLPMYGVSEVLSVEGGYAFVVHLPMEESYIEENFEELKRKTYYVTLNKILDQRMEEMTLEMTDFGSSLDLLDLPVIDADGGEWLFILMIVLISVAAVGGVVAVVYLVKYRKQSTKKKNQKHKKSKK